MDMIKVLGVGITGAVLALVVKDSKPQIALVISISAAAVLMLMILSQIEYVLNVVYVTASSININMEHISAIFKMIGVSYLSQIGSLICKDAGQSAIAAKVELAGKIIIVVLSVPILLELMNLLVGLLP
jgi:stage III sporulation protein AD